MPTLREAARQEPDRVVDPTGSTAERQRLKATAASARVDKRFGDRELVREVDDLAIARVAAISCPTSATLAASEVAGALAFGRACARLLAAMSQSAVVICDPRVRKAAGVSLTDADP